MSIAPMCSKCGVFNTRGTPCAIGGCPYAPVTPMTAAPVTPLTADEIADLRKLDAEVAAYDPRGKLNGEIREAELRLGRPILAALPRLLDIAADHARLVEENGRLRKMTEPPLVEHGPNCGCRTCVDTDWEIDHG